MRRIALYNDATEYDATYQEVDLNLPNILKSKRIIVLVDPQVTDDAALDELYEEGIELLNSMLLK